MCPVDTFGSMISTDDAMFLTRLSGKMWKSLSRAVMSVSLAVDVFGPARNPFWLDQVAANVKDDRLERLSHDPGGGRACASF